MIFQYSWEKILTGEKTQTRQLVKPGESLTRIYTPYIPVGHPKPYFQAVFLNTSQRVKWIENGAYAVQPGRTKKGIARIEITDIRREDVRNISDEDSKAEGFDSNWHFLQIWTEMHDTQVSIFSFMTDPQSVHWIGGTKAGWKQGVAWGETHHILPHLMLRPAEKYQAWVLTFKLVEV